MVLLCRRTDLGVHEEAVKQAKASRQRVMVRGDGDVREIDQAWVAIAFWHVPKHLIVGAVLFDDVHHMMKRWIVPGRRRTLPVIRRDDAMREASQLRRRQGRGEHAERAVQLSQRVRFGLLKWQFVSGTGPSGLAWAPWPLPERMRS